MTVALANLDTPFATLGRACVRSLRNHLADMGGPLRLPARRTAFDADAGPDEQDVRNSSDIDVRISSLLSRKAGLPCSGRGRPSR